MTAPPAPASAPYTPRIGEWVIRDGAFVDQVVGWAGGDYRMKSGMTSRPADLAPMALESAANEGMEP